MAAAVEEPTVAPAAAAPPSAACRSCGSGLAPGAAFCRACGAAVADDAPTLVSPVAPVEPPPVVAAGAPAKSGGRSPWFALGLVALVLIFGGGGGAAAYAFVLKKDDGSGDVAPPAASSSSASDYADSPDPVPASDAPDTSDADTTTAPASSDETDDSSSADSSSTGTADDGAGEEPGSPEATLRTHFEDIDTGNYDAAWQLLYPAYRETTGANWVGQREKERARIDVISIKRQSEPSPDVVKLDATIVAADTGGPGAGVCRLFSGWTRMQKSGGEWKYRPGEVDGVKPGFSANAVELDSSDERCSPVLD